MKTEVQNAVIYRAHNASVGESLRSGVEWSEVFSSVSWWKMILFCHLSAVIARFVLHPGPRTPPFGLPGSHVTQNLGLLKCVHAEGAELTFPHCSTAPGVQ